MTLELFRAILGWSALINIGILTLWFLMVAVARDWMYQLHSRFYNIPEAHFDSLHYAGMMFYKIAVWLFFIAPYLALRIVA